MTKKYSHNLKKNNKMEIKPKKTEKNNTGKIAIVSIAVLTGLWLWNRAKILVKTIDEATKSIHYEATIGLKKIEGVISLYAPTTQTHVFGKKELMVQTHGDDTIALTITHTETGKVLDEIVVNFDGSVKNTAATIGIMPDVNLHCSNNIKNGTVAANMQNAMTQLDHHNATIKQI